MPFNAIHVSNVVQLQSVSQRAIKVKDTYIPQIPMMVATSSHRHFMRCTRAKMVHLTWKSYRLVQFWCPNARLLTILWLEMGSTVMPLPPAVRLYHRAMFVSRVCIVHCRRISHATIIHQSGPRGRGDTKFEFEMVCPATEGQNGFQVISLSS